MAVFALLVLAPLKARADGSDHPPNQDERVITIGPQAVIVEDARGQVRMYDDPSQQEAACKSSLSCLAHALGVYGVAAFLVYDNLPGLGLDNNRITPPRLSSPGE